MLIVRLQILRLISRDLHSDVSVRLENHQRKWSTWLNVAENEFGEHIEADLTVCNGLNDSDWEGEEE